MLISNYVIANPIQKKYYVELIKNFEIRKQFH